MEKGKPEILKKSSKTRDQFTATSDFQYSEERVLFQAGNRQLSRQFPEKVLKPQVLNCSASCIINSNNRQAQISVDWW